MSQSTQLNALLEEVVRNVSRHGEVTDKLRRDVAGHASEVAKLQDTILDLRRQQESRFRALVSADARGGLFGRESEREQAAQLGRFARALLRRDQAELDTLMTAGVTPDSGPYGGYLLPEALTLNLLRDVEEGGVFLRNCPPIKVAALTGGTSKPTAGVTLYYPDYGVAATVSTPTVGLLNWSLKRHTAAVEVDNWMLASGLEAALGEYIRREFVLALTIGTDTNWFMGDGTAEYCGYTGLFKDANIAIVDAASGDDTFDEVIAESTGYLSQMMGALPTWAHGPDCRWYMHLLNFFKFLGVRDTVGQPIANVLMSQQVPSLYLFGYPVEAVQVAPTESAVSTVFALLGNLRRACRTFEHSQAVTFKSSTDVKFLEAQTVMAMDVPLDRVVYNAAGVVGLKTAAE